MAKPETIDIRALCDRSGNDDIVFALIEEVLRLRKRLKKYENPACPCCGAAFDGVAGTKCASCGAACLGMGPLMLTPNAPEEQKHRTIVAGDLM